MRLARWTFLTATVASGLVAGLLPASANAAPMPFIQRLAPAKQVSTTVPANGDVNPYGVAVVGKSSGKLVSGHVLVSNFNSKANVQGTGTTIVQVSPSGATSVFANVAKLPKGEACPGGVGLSTALNVLPGGWVVVGSLPTKGGALPKGDPAGCLIVLNDNGRVVKTIVSKNIVGPWDMTATSTATSAALYVSNSLGGNTATKNGVPVAGKCTVVRIDLALSSSAAPTVTKTTVIGTNFPWRANADALVLAPTGLALGSNGTLYVDNSLTNTVSAIPSAATRSTAANATSTIISKGGGLDAPLGMILAPNGDLLVVNGNNGVATEISPSGKQVATRTLVKNGAGDLFGLSLTPNRRGIYFVNDGTNALDVATLPAA
jgi:hypothetical protein